MNQKKTLIELARRHGGFVSFDLPKSGSLSSPIIPIVGWYVKESHDDVWFEANGKRIDYAQMVARPAIQARFPDETIVGFDYWIDAYNYLVRPSRAIHIIARNKQGILAERYVKVVPTSRDEAETNLLTFFLHVAKTGGTAIRFQMFRGGGGRELVESIALPQGGRILPGYSPLPHLKSLTEVGLLGFDIVIGHFLYGLHTITRRPYKYMSVLRDPYEFLISLYYSVKLDAKLDVPSIGEFIQRPYLDNHFCRTICGIESGEAVQIGRDDLDQAKDIIEREFLFIGLTEELAATARRMSELLGMDLVTGLRRENVTTSSDERNALDRKPFERAAYERVKFDLELFDYVRKRFFK